MAFTFDSSCAALEEDSSPIYVTSHVGDFV